jgi:hypothetical protein
MIRITDNLGNWAEAEDNEETAEASAGVAVETLLKDSPHCTTIVVTRCKTEVDLMNEFNQIIEEASARMWGK